MPRIPVGNTFLAEHDRPAVIGARLWPSDAPPPDNAPTPYYQHPRGILSVGDSLAWLDGLAAGSVALAVADPPYNLGKADWDTFDSRDEYIAWSRAWIERDARVLTADGSLYLFGFSEIVADLHRPAMAHFAACRWLVWSYRNKANLRHDWGRSHESILHLRKRARVPFYTDDVRVPYGQHTLRYPERSQAASSQYGGGKPRADTWRPNPRGAKPRDVFEIPVLTNGMPEKTPHPTQKPEELVRTLILASSRPGELVIDPFAGSGTTLVCASQLERRFAGCELVPEHCRWAMLRLETTPARSVADWIEHDRANARHRASIR